MKGERFMKPGIKFLIVFNCVLNIPMAIAMSVTAPLLVGMPVFTPNLLINILIGFVLATLINLLIPIPKITAGFAALCRQDPESVPGRILGNIPACLIFVVVIGLVMNLYNVRKVPDFLFAFIGTFLPMYLVCFVVALIFMPIAVKAATAADGR